VVRRYSAMNPDSFSGFCNLAGKTDACIWRFSSYQVQHLLDSQGANHPWKVQVSSCEDLQALRLLSKRYHLPCVYHALEVSFRIAFCGFNGIRSR
ncbi:TPA: hypothetical protein ACTV5X_002321, partial [Enterobacter roggenkampii]